MPSSDQARGPYPKIPRLRVEVTQELIDESVKRDSSHCMITDAVKAQIPYATSIETDIQTIRWTDAEKGYRYIYLTPRPVQEFLVKFDQGEPVAPFSFQARGTQVIRSGGHTHAKAQAVLPDKPTMIIEPAGRGSQPVRIGGTPPPKARYGGNHRRFGIRGLNV